MSSPFHALRGGRLLLGTRSRLLPPRCPFAPISARFAHKKHARISKRKADEPGLEGLPAPLALLLKQDIPQTTEEAARFQEPPSDEYIDSPDTPEFTMYVEDPTSPTGEKLLRSYRTPEERRYHRETELMIEEDMRDPDYDDAELNRRLIDELMLEPSMADLQEDLLEIKRDILPKPERRKREEQQRKEAEEQEKEEEPLFKELEASMQMATHESLQELIQDPDLQSARAELEELRDTLPEDDDLENPDFLAAVEKVKEKLAGDETLQQKMAAIESRKGEQFDEDFSAEDYIEAMDKFERTGNTADAPEDMQDLLEQIKDLTISMGMGKNFEDIDRLQEEMEKVINMDPVDLEDEDEDEEEEMGREVDFDQLSQELLDLAKSTPDVEGASRAIDEDGEIVDPELEAKVDQIMQDPKLMEKMMYIQGIIKEEQEKAASLVDIQHELAPDPLKLEPHRVTTIKQRLAAVRRDPQHLAALQALRVNLLPPFNVAPALRLFNQAIEYAYIGANDDIRRILWRSYFKARTLPTFIQNLSDDAWDIIYYSQAVTWRSNQNRRNHLQLLLQDLKSVGKDGPPTHPSTLAEK